MTPEELADYRQNISEKHLVLVGFADDLPVAGDDVESEDHHADSVAEAIFLRGFTTYESHIEKLFFHYVTGGLSANGVAAASHLKPSNEEIARKIVKAGFKFLSWAKPSNTSLTAQLYLENGWPLVDMMATKTQELSDCERIRNRIAHLSTESATDFGVVQRNLLATERLFSITPGQLLRIRHRRHRMSNLKRYLNVMYETIDSIIDPPP
ncbi:hypothetical protein PVA19_04235 [Agrobacterium sp. CNPSo 3708]|uniref:hypothetical protein n=1 Tax=Agrobacterium sp. CNPSo 3708 TaxID=3028150 RepID=UPI00236419B6|nr:hypothetical protein [Agrobacterium sp. CNPSo 3708]MDD1497610.1 hypothetical protein [Agrobacterium sp. CNPSo 3708]